MHDSSIQARAERIRDVIRYISKFKNATIVIYFDDRIIGTPMFTSHIRDISLIHEAGLHVLLVPGAHTHIDRELSEHGISWTVKNGSRITQEDAMPLIKTAAFEVSNKVMTSLASRRLTAVIGNWVRARAKGVLDGVDYGTSGEIDRIDDDAIRTVLGNGFIPIFPCIGWSLAGKPYNISSMQLASQIAMHMQADKLFFLVPDAELSAQYFTVPATIGLSPDGCIPAMNIEELDEFLRTNGGEGRDGDDSAGAGEREARGERNAESASAGNADSGATAGAITEARREKSDGGSAGSTGNDVAAEASTAPASSALADKCGNSNTGADERNAQAEERERSRAVSEGGNSRATAHAAQHCFTGNTAPLAVAGASIAAESTSADSNAVACATSAHASAAQADIAGSSASASNADISGATAISAQQCFTGNTMPLVVAGASITAKSTSADSNATENATSAHANEVQADNDDSAINAGNTGTVTNAALAPTSSAQADKCDSSNTDTRNANISGTTVLSAQHCFTGNTAPLSAAAGVSAPAAHPCAAPADSGTLSLRGTVLSMLHLARTACMQGVTRVHILNSSLDGTLPCEIFSNFGSGTMIYSSNYGKIRPMRREDIAAVLSLIRPFVERKILLPRSEETLSSQCNDYIVYELDGAIRACAALHVYEDAAANGGRQAEIAAVAVDETCAHIGIGPKIIEHLIAKARQLGMGSVFVLTTQTSDWFEKLGFASDTIASMPEKRRKLWSPERGSKLLRLKL